MTGRIRTVADMVTMEMGPYEPVELEGGICNLLRTDLYIVDAATKLRCKYEREQMGPAEVVWQDGERRRLAPQLVPPILSDVCLIGSYNHGYIDLVAPTQDLTGLLDFWKRAVQTQQARQYRLPNMKPWRKRSGMRLYCVVSVGVALTAFFRYEEIDQLLVPACPHPCTDGIVGYEALMPVEYLLAGQKVTR